MTLLNFSPAQINAALAVLRAAIYLIAGYFIARLSSKAVMRFYDKKRNGARIALIQKTIFYIVFALFFVSALRELGFDLKVLLGATGILTVAIGFASQTSASNLISGLFLVAERALHVGDIINITGITGEVLSIDLFSVKLKQSDNTIVRIPNEVIIKNPLVNLTHFSERRFDCVFAVPADTNMEKLRQAVLNMLAQQDFCLISPAPQIFVKEIADKAINMQLQVWATQEHFNEMKIIVQEHLLQMLRELQIPVADDTVTVKLIK